MIHRVGSPPVQGADVALLGQQGLDAPRRPGSSGTGTRKAISARGPVPPLEVHQLVPDPLRAIAADLAPAAAAEQAPGAGEEQLQMVVQLGEGPDGGAGPHHRVGLIDGDGRRYAVDALRPRPVHAVEELAGIGREGLDIAPLALGVDGVEGQRRLAASPRPR